MHARGACSVLLLALALGGCAGSSAAAPGRAALVRVDQVGYPTAGPKLARVLATIPVARTPFAVVDAGGAVVLRGRAGRDLGAWNARLRHVAVLDLSALRRPGAYRIVLSGALRGGSPTFRVDSAAALYAPVAAAAVRYLRAQRDGPNVDTGLLHRQPSHLADRSAGVYDPPRYRGYHLTAAPRRVGGPLDVSGGWMDAGDTLKYAETASFADAMLLEATLRTPGGLGAALPAAQAEARFGLDWLLKLWDPQSRTLIYQVGLGDGNGYSILGAHDARWRLPQADDALHARPGSPQRFVEHRPAFRAGPPGAPISPNLAGRLAAAYALGAQAYQASDPAFAARCLAAARSIFAQARTTHVGQLLTASPHAYYPEREWRDDLELGAVEIALAARAAGDPGWTTDLAAAGRWAEAYALSPLNGTDTLNLYDVAPLAHAELARALELAGATNAGGATRRSLAGDLAGQVAAARAKARRDPFGSGWSYGDDDDVAHWLGLSATATIEGRLSGRPQDAALGATQRDLVLGDNAWGASFIVGVGSVFPRCLHSPLANLSGSLDGRPPLLAGATVPGPVAPGDLSRLALTPGYRPCPAGGGDPNARFTGHGARYRDGVVDSATNEPSIDLGALAVLAFARQAAG